ncbi:alpha/beta fold hydrolase [Kocuria sp. KH4]
MRWLEHGTGALVVLVHGIPTSPRLWRHVMPLVAGRSLAGEMPGYGRSMPEGRGRDLSLAAQARYLLEWLDALALEQQPVLVGRDLGGGMAQIAATRAPGRFAGLVLTNAVAYDSRPIPSVKAMQRVAPILAHTPEALLYPTFAQLIHRGHDDHRIALEPLGEHWAPYVTHGAAAAMMAQVRAQDVQDTLDIAGQLPALSLPARVVWGCGRPVPEVALRSMAGRRPRHRTGPHRGWEALHPRGPPATGRCGRQCPARPSMISGSVVWVFWVGCPRR